MCEIIITVYIGDLFLEKVIYATIYIKNIIQNQIIFLVVVPVCEKVLTLQNSIWTLNKNQNNNRDKFYKKSTSFIKFT